MYPDLGLLNEDIRHKEVGKKKGLRFFKDSVYTLDYAEHMMLKIGIGIGIGRCWF